ncbi:MAG: alkaline phosphatase family protein, partial [Armatimonadetes bacterium]|nr:alkaline phosphatase family protein [Armatimonadota bacterium]
MEATEAVLLVSIDGLRPDALEQADTPRLDALRARGRYTPSARSIMPSVTLPCHMTMFLGVPPARHGITTNLYTPPARPVAGILDVARGAGRRTAACYNWEQLRDLGRPGSLDRVIFQADCYSQQSDLALARQAAALLAAEPFDLTFLYLGHTDAAGHDHGWMSGPYLEAVETADRALGLVLDALATAGRLAQTAVVVLADHGGHDRSHGTDCPEDMTIPLLLAVPGEQPGAIDGPAGLLDVAPTVAELLHLAR